MRIKANDTVVILSGDDKGVRGKVVSIDHASGKVLVEGVNKVYKHVKRSQKNPQGGRLSMEMPVQISNVAYYCQACGKGVRVVGIATVGPRAHAVEGVAVVVPVHRVAGIGAVTPYQLHRAPVDAGPQGSGQLIGPFSEDAHRLTSPMTRALLRFLPARTSRTSAPFRVR